MYLRVDVTKASERVGPVVVGIVHLRYPVIGMIYINIRSRTPTTCQLLYIHAKPGEESDLLALE
jgi:hypothetical protein